jgi:ClpP class serine protease
LEEKGIRPLVFRGGKDKAPVGMIGEITDEGKQTTQKMIEQTHDAFKGHVLKARPILKNQIKEVGSGHVWLGVDAIKLNLIDAIKSSDEYIEEKLQEGACVLKLIENPTPVISFVPRHRSIQLNGSRLIKVGLFQKISNLLKDMVQLSFFNFLSSTAPPNGSKMCSSISASQEKDY